MRVQSETTLVFQKESYYSAKSKNPSCNVTENTQNNKLDLSVAKTNSLSGRISDSQSSRGITLSQLPSEAIFWKRVMEGDRNTFHFIIRHCIVP